MMSLTFILIRNAGRRKAKKWLEDHNVEMNEIHIVENPPSKDELKSLYEKRTPAEEIFNTSGKKYRELGLKDKVNSASDDELLDILSSDGMLIKRPLTTDGNKVSVGFKEETFAEMWK